MIFSISELDKTNSTNDEVLRLAKNGAKEGTVVAAKRQLSGRGTKGRSFLSPKGGLYFSLLLRPKTTDCITAMAAVAVMRAIRKETGAPAVIKWTNDIYLSGKKLSGILCEAVYGGDQSPEFVILGIGINLKDPHFKGELSDIATSLEQEGYSFDRRVLLERILSEFDKIYTEADNWLDDYRKYSVILGRKITVLDPNGSYEAFAESINEKGHLTVRRNSGESITLFSGEVSVRDFKKQGKEE